MNFAGTSLRWSIVYFISACAAKNHHDTVVNEQAVRSSRRTGCAWNNETEFETIDRNEESDREDDRKEIRQQRRLLVRWFDQQVRAKTEKPDDIAGRQQSEGKHLHFYLHLVFLAWLKVTMDGFMFYVVKDLRGYFW